MTPSHARAPRGQRAVCKRSTQRGRNISIAGAIGLSGFKALYPYDGAVNTERFLDFLDKLLPKLQKDNILVMDNVRTHHTQVVKEKINAAGLKVIYLPPYHPELNPIEEAWFVIKNMLRKCKSRNLDEYIKALEISKAEVTPQKIKGFFKHSGYFLPA